MNTGEKIIQRAKVLGITKYDLLRKANLSHSMLDAWKEREPKTLEALERINCILEIEEEKKGILSLKKKVLFFLEKIQKENDFDVTELIFLIREMKK